MRDENGREVGKLLADTSQENEGIEGACERARRRAPRYGPIDGQELEFMAPPCEPTRYRNPEDAFARVIQWTMVLCCIAVVAVLLGSFGVGRGWW